MTWYILTVWWISLF